MIEESIYNLVPQYELPQPKKKRYISKYPHNIAPTGSTFISKTTSRPIVANLNGDLEIFQGPHKHIGNHSMMGIKQEKFQYLDLRKPKLPSKDDQPLFNLKSNKNYILQNVLDNILKVPQKPQEKKTYLQKENYGQVPKYLEKIKTQISKEYEHLQSLEYEKQKKMQNNRVQLSSEEIQELKQGLQKRWETVNKDYQSITHIQKIDTHGLKRNCEQQLAQIEKDMKLLEKPMIFIDYH